MHTRLKTVGGVAFCVGAAALFALVMNGNTNLRLAATLAGLLIVGLTAWMCGRVAAILGAVGADVVFCFLLFPPIGSFGISDPSEQFVVMVFPLLAVAVTFVVEPSVHFK